MFVYGSGKRKTEVQREYEKYEEWLEKLDSYEKHLAVMGERNSYAKTDPDATFTVKNHGKILLPKKES